MGQKEVFDFLKEHSGEWFTSKQISKALDISIGSVTMSLKKLRQADLIDYEHQGKRNAYLYKIG